MKFSDLEKMKSQPITPARLAGPAREAARQETAAAAFTEAPAAPPATALPAVHKTPELPITLHKNLPGPLQPFPPSPVQPATKPSDTGRIRKPQGTELPFNELDNQARRTYARLVSQAEEFLKRTAQPYTEQYRAVKAACTQVTETLRVNPVLLSYAAYSTSDGYLAGHTANTTLISLAIGINYGLEGKELDLLGFCAMAHDIGMTGYASIYNNSSRLTDDDFAEMTLHAEESVAKLDCIVDLDYKVKERARLIVMQVHERLDGSGYPSQLKAGEIDPLAQIIGIADAYEAMTHPRTWREAKNPPDVVKELIEREGRNFNAKAVRSLIAILSVYPPGSLTVLSTGEIARVIKVNKGSLTRPMVEIVADNNFTKVPFRTMDLIKYPLTAIERPIDLSELEERNPELAASLELARWWVD